MINKRTLLLLLVCSVFMFACEYIVVPEEDAVGFTYGVNKGWSGVATRIGRTTAGDLRIELAIRESRRAIGAPCRRRRVSRPSWRTGGQKTDCETVFVGTGGHRLAPGFRMRGYIAGKKAEPQRAADLRGVQGRRSRRRLQTHHRIQLCDRPVQLLRAGEEPGRWSDGSRSRQGGCGPVLSGRGTTRRVAPGCQHGDPGPE